MTNSEIIKIMDQQMSTSKVGYYREIYKQVSGEDWTSCLCGNGFNRLYQYCKNYAESLKKQNHDL